MNARHSAARALGLLALLLAMTALIGHLWLPGAVVTGLALAALIGALEAVRLARGGAER